MLVDANLLLYAVDRQSAFYRQASAWLVEALNGGHRVGIPWQTIGAFLRIATHPRIWMNPLNAQEAVDFVNGWLEMDTVWVPTASDRTAAVLATLIERYQVTGNLVMDAQLAALAIEHGLEVLSADTDFVRFREVRWRNPLT